MIPGSGVWGFSVSGLGFRGSGCSLYFGFRGLYALSYWSCFLFIGLRVQGLQF